MKFPQVKFITRYVHIYRAFQAIDVNKIKIETDAYICMYVLCQVVVVINGQFNLINLNLAQLQCWNRLIKSRYFHRFNVFLT